MHVDQIPASGHLAAPARKKYGFRACRRNEALNKMFADLKVCCHKKVEAITDQSTNYHLRSIRTFPQGKHTRYKGRRGCVVGQGELKRGGFDPLFSLNHTAAMLRDNIKRLTRRTWCTTKKIANLEHLLNIYAWYHNLNIKKEPLKLRPGSCKPQFRAAVSSHCKDHM